ncbi:MAG: acyl carrier protein [Ruminococcaceae bacterium]|nr:acyl carrier protein [Oscillospiraceae bacterium]
MFEEIKGIIAKQLRIKPEEIKNSDRLIEDLGADSLEMAEVLMTIEDKHGIYISDEDVLKIKTVQDIADYLDNM